MYFLEKANSERQKIEVITMKKEPRNRKSNFLVCTDFQYGGMKISEDYWRIVIVSQQRACKNDNHTVKNFSDKFYVVNILSQYLKTNRHCLNVVKYNLW
jgi:hypothetical protein